MHKPIGSKTMFLKSIDSTNSYLKHELSNNKPEEGFLICTDEQFSGRGQRTNSWESEAGKNLLLSFVLYPNFLKANKQFALSKAISLAVYDFILQFTNEVSIKWPNDIYIGNMKVAGILIENSLKGATISSSIIGLGININQEKFSKNIPNAISLHTHTGKTYNKSELLVVLTKKLNYWYKQLLSNRIDFIDEQYLSKLFRYKQTHFFIIEGQKVEAMIMGVAPDGKLIIETENGIQKSFAFKEIEYFI